MPNMSKTLHGESDDDKALALLAPASRRATSKSTNVSLFDAEAVCAILACRASSWPALCRPSSAWRCVDISHSIPTHAARRLSLCAIIHLRPKTIVTRLVSSLRGRSVRDLLSTLPARDPKPILASYVAQSISRPVSY
jgi:hypothetical protein